MMGKGGEVMTIKLPESLPISQTQHPVDFHLAPDPNR